MKIGELASRTGLNASAIRYYEKLGLLVPPYRIAGQRRYPDDDVYRVLLIRFASDMGFTLCEIKLFLSGLRDKAPVGPRWRKLAVQKVKEVDEKSSARVGSSRSSNSYCSVTVLRSRSVSSASA